METYKVKVTSVDYCIEEEDVCWQFDNDPSIEEDSEEYYDAIHKEIERIEASLPQTLELEVGCDPEDIEDMVVDAISQETGWLINNCTYEVMQNKPRETWVFFWIIKHG